MKPDWQIENTPVAYDYAVACMEKRVAAIRNGGGNDLVWLLEHPSLYTAGTSSNPRDLLNQAFPVHQSGRGGQYTYHGPGQRIAYVMMDLQKRGSDLRHYIHDLEEWVINTLRGFGVNGQRREKRVGVWVDYPRGVEKKIAAVGVRVRKWVSYHGVSINVNPDLSHYNGIIPCGIKEYGVTSLEALGVKISASQLDQALQEHWEKIFYY